MVVVYSTYFFEMAGIGSPFQNTCIMSGVGSFVLIVNSLIITKYGLRRVFLSWGMVLCGLSQLIMAAVYTAHPGTILTGKVKCFLEIEFTKKLINLIRLLWAARFSISQATTG